MSSTCFEHLVFIIRKTICTCIFLCFSCIYVSTLAGGTMCASFHLLDFRPRVGLPVGLFTSGLGNIFPIRDMAYPSLPPRFGHSNDTCLGVQVMTPHITPCSDVLGLNCSQRLQFVWIQSKTSLPLFGWWYAALFVVCSSVSVVTGLRVRLPRNHVWMSGRDGWCFPSRRRLDQPSFSCSVDTGSSSSGDKAVRAWRWPLTTI